MVGWFSKTELETNEEPKLTMSMMLALKVYIWYLVLVWQVLIQFLQKNQKSDKQLGMMMHYKVDK